MGGVSIQKYVSKKGFTFSFLIAANAFKLSKVFTV